MEAKIQYGHISAKWALFHISARQRLRSDRRIRSVLRGISFWRVSESPWHGTSDTIHISFSRPVDEVSVSIADPDFPGNKLVVNSDSGSTSYNFVGDNTPNRYTEYTIGTPDHNVNSIDLIPADTDYVAYFGLSFVVDDSIVVTCTPASVPRASQSIACTASASDTSVSLLMQEWRFVGGPNNVINVTQATSSTSWVGPIATTGTISASGTLNSQLPVSGSRVVTAIGRDWSTMMPQIAVREQNPSGLPSKPVRVGELGNTALPIDTSAWIFDDGWAAIPPTGPNGGVHYLTKVPINIELVVRVNRGALTVGSQFYNRQPPNSPPPGMCRRADVVPFVPVVERHEGLQWETGSHTERYRTRLNQIAGLGTEGVVGMTYNDLQSKANQTVGPLYQDAAARSALADDPANRPVYCTFRYF